ncbi:MAG: ABC transporter permease [Beijerinckiaceae bacterium]
MASFLTRRLVIALLVAFTVSVVGFALLRLSGDLASVLAGEDASAEDIARIARQYGLDRPFYVQYFDWLSGALSGDLGQSLFTHEPVWEMIVTRLPVTATLAFVSLFVGLIIAIPLGVLAAVKANTWADRSALFVAVMGQATPSFWFALILIYVFGVWWRQASVFGVKLAEIKIFGMQLSGMPISGGATWLHYVLPVVTLATFVMPAIMRITRTGMMEVLASDYVRTARAKGLGTGKVLFKHALRNAILPVVSLAAVQLGFLLSGSVIVESIFALNGVGYLAFQSIVRIDFPVVQSILVFLACTYILLTLIADLINARLDPRVRLE